jgi:hypothetical protein
MSRRLAIFSRTSVRRRFAATGVRDSEVRAFMKGREDVLDNNSFSAMCGLQNVPGPVRMVTLMRDALIAGIAPRSSNRR